MNLKSVLHKNAPAILAAAGVAGFIGAIVMTAKAAPSAEEVLSEDPDAPLLEKAKKIAPFYIPVVSMVMISTGCIVASTRIQTYRYLSLLTLYSISERNLAKWQQSVIDEVGEKRADKVRRRVVTPDEPIPHDLTKNDADLICHDYFSGQFFNVRSVDVIKKVVNEANESLLRKDFISVNDFYFELGVQPMELGNKFGWMAQDGLIEVRYDSMLYDDRPILAISFKTEPKEERY